MDIDYFVWNILCYGNYINNHIEMQSLSCVNKQLNGLYQCNIRSNRLNWFFSKSLNISSNTIDNLIKLGEKDILQWLDDYGIEIKWSEYKTRICINKNYINILDWVYFKKNIKNIWSCSWFMRIAAENGNIGVLKWAHSNDMLQKEEWDEWTIRYVATNGHVNVLEWAYQNKFINHTDIWNEWIIRSIAKSGKVNILDWIHNKKLINRSVWNLWITRAAAENNLLDVIKWAHERTYMYHTWNHYTRQIVERKSNFEMLEWLNNNGYI